MVADALRDAFYNCTSLTSVSFPKLTTIGGPRGFHGTFSGCTSLETVYFPSLTTVHTNAFAQSGSAFGFNNTPSLTAIHFPASIQSTIESTYDYSNVWGHGADASIIKFDL